MFSRRTLLPATAAIVGLAAVSVSQAAAAPLPTIGVGSNPIAIAISQAQSQAYVANDGSVSIVNLKTHTQTAEISTTVNHGQTAIGSFVRGKKVYIGDFALPTMVAFNPQTHAVTPGIRVGPGATDIVAAGIGKAYVTLSAQGGAKGRVQVVNTTSNKLMGSVLLSNGAGTATTAPGNRYLWVGCIQSGKIWVIDATTNRIVRKLNASRSGPISGIAFNPSGTQVWVVGLGGISVISRSSGKLLAFLPITMVFPGGPNPGPISFNKSGSKVLVVNSGFPGNPVQGTLGVIDPATLKVTQRITLGVEPIGMALDNRRNTTYIANYQDDTLSYLPTPK
jgi:YVTN family beta-propeller protein